MEEVSDFPGGENDDLVDATTLALARFREGGFLQLTSDILRKSQVIMKAKGFIINQNHTMIYQHGY